MNYQLLFQQADAATGVQAVELPLTDKTEKMHFALFVG
jgi:hypothetical protein